MPFGVSGIWLGCCFVIYSFIGVEIVGVTSGEASDPARTIPRAVRRIVIGLSTIYVVTIALLLMLTPWSQLGVGESPFVSVLRRLGIPGAAGRDELRGAERRAVELERQPLSDRAHAVLAGARGIRAGAIGRGQSSRRAGGRAARVGPRTWRRRAGARPLARFGVRVVLWRGALRRAVRVADDLRHAHCVSQIVVAVDIGRRCRYWSARSCCPRGGCRI